MSVHKLDARLPINIICCCLSQVIASHNGDPSCHTPNLAPWHMSFYGLVRGLVQVTHDTATPLLHRRRLTQIDVEGGLRTTIADPDYEQEQAPGAVATDIEVTASAPGLASASLKIPLSADVAAHSVLASAEQSVVASAPGMRWIAA